MTQILLNLYHIIEKQMVLRKFITSTWLSIKNRLARLILDKISKDEQPDIVDKISTLNYILSSENFKSVSVGWNSPNKEIESKFENVQDEIFELTKIVKFIERKNDRKISSGYLNFTDKKIDICFYFRDKNKNQLNVDESIKTITQLVSILLRSYEEIRKDTSSYEFLIISSVFEQLQKTLTSLSLLK
jgi:hypothetical protein